MKILVSLTFALVAAITVTACASFEEAGEEADEAVESVADGIEDAGDEIEEETDDLG